MRLHPGWLTKEPGPPGGSRRVETRVRPLLAASVIRRLGLVLFLSVTALCPRVYADFLKNPGF